MYHNKEDTLNLKNMKSNAKEKCTFAQHITEPTKPEALLREDQLIRTMCL